GAVGPLGPGAPVRAHFGVEAGPSPGSLHGPHGRLLDVDPGAGGSGARPETRARSPHQSLVAPCVRAPNGPYREPFSSVTPGFTSLETREPGSRAPDRVPSGPVWCHLDTWWCQQR